MYPKSDFLISKICNDLYAIKYYYTRTLCFNKQLVLKARLEIERTKLLGSELSGSDLSGLDISVRLNSKRTYDLICSIKLPSLQGLEKIPVDLLYVKYVLTDKFPLVKTDQVLRISKKRKWGDVYFTNIHAFGPFLLNEDTLNWIRHRLENPSNIENEWTIWMSQLNQ